MRLVSSDLLRRCLNCRELIISATENHCSEFCLLALDAELSCSNSPDNTCVVKHNVSVLDEGQWHWIIRVETRQPQGWQSPYLNVWIRCHRVIHELYEARAIPLLRYGPPTCMRCMVAAKT